MGTDRDVTFCHEPILAAAPEDRDRMPITVLLDRFRLAAREETYWQTSREETLYVFLCASGSVCVAGSGACWQQQITGPTVLWVPPGAQHGFRNTGDGDARGVAVTASIAKPRLTEVTAGESSPSIVPLADVPQVCMVSFLTRSVLAREGSSGLIRLCEIQTVLPGGDVPSHVHSDRAEVAYVLCGWGLFSIDGQDREVRAGSGLFIPPGERHCVHNRSDGVLEYVIVQAGIGTHGAG